MGESRARAVYGICCRLLCRATGRLLGRLTGKDDAAEYNHMSTSSTPRDVQGRGDPVSARVFMASTAFATVAAIGLELARETARMPVLYIVGWILVLSVVELLPVPLSSQLRLSLAFPILLGIAMLYPPPTAALIALVGSFDARELRRQMTMERAGFNRAQIALATWAASTVFHSIASVDSGLGVIPAAMAASTAGCWPMPR